MARKRVAANFHNKPLQPREPRDPFPLRDQVGPIAAQLTEFWRSAGHISDGDFSCKSIRSELPHLRKTDDPGVESKHVAEHLSFGRSSHRRYRAESSARDVCE